MGDSTPKRRPLIRKDLHLGSGSVLPKSSRHYSLTAKEAAFLGLYTNPEARNPRTGKRTYNNATQSADAVYDTKDLTTSASIGSENLRKPRILNALDTLFNAAGLRDQDSVAIIAGIAHGTAERVSTWEVVDSKGNVRTLQAKRRPSFRDSLTAVKMRHELTGKAQAAAVVGKQAGLAIAELMKRHMAGPTTKKRGDRNSDPSDQDSTPGGSDPRPGVAASASQPICPSPVTSDREKTGGTP